uniref:Uncharacterized protein n=1 Tax=viral metagenome TaxID=1070528 RepID=A0A6C0D334_9ZZZZ
MIQEIPFAIYIKDEESIDVSLNVLPLSIEIVPHTASVVMNLSTNNTDYTGTFEYKFKVFFILFSFSIMTALISFLFLLSK